MQMEQGGSASYLKNIYEGLSQSNPQFSQRAFARKLGLSPGGLSQIFAGRKKLSVARAHEIAEALRLSLDEQEYFLLLVQMESARSHAIRSQLYERLKARHPQRVAETQNLTLEQFRLVSDWFGFAILQLVSNYGAKWTIERMAKHLGIKKIEAEMTLERLLKLQLIEETSSGYQRVADRIIVGSAVPNEAIQNYYRGVLKKAEASISEQLPTEKVAGAEVFAFDPADLEKVKKLTDQYLDSLLELAKAGKNRSEMYQVVVDFFRLSEKSENVHRQERKKS